MKQLLAGLILMALPALPQGFREAGGGDLSDARIQEIITKFATNEANFAKAREQYTYRQTARVHVLDAGGRAADVVLDTVREIGGIVEVVGNHLHAARIDAEVVVGVVDEVVRQVVGVRVDQEPRLVGLTGRYGVGRLGRGVAVVRPVPRG